MQSSVIIEGVSREEFLRYMDELKCIVKGRVEKKEYTTQELSDITGYSRSHLRLLIKEKSIPFRKDGRDIVIAHQFLGQFKTKKTVSINS